MVRECVKTCYLKCETCFVAWYVMNFLFACSWKECVGTLSLLPYFLITTYLVFLLIVYYFKKLSAVALPSKTKWAFSPIPWSLSSLSALKLCNDWPLSPHDSTLKLSRFFSSEVCVCVCVCVSVHTLSHFSHVWLCDPMDCSYIYVYLSYSFLWSGNFFLNTKLY